MAPEQQTRTTNSKAEDGQEPPLYGDILDAILSRVPLLNLVPASHVSKSWCGAVSTSICNRNIKSWIILHTQTTRSSYNTTARAYDPTSHVWIDIHPQPSIRPPISILRSSHSTLLYMLSPAKFTFSTDPLHHTWHETIAPLVWRTDPIVAMVGNRVIVAGGTCDYEDDPLAVEMYDVNSRTWGTCNSMPAILKDSAASTWLSAAVDGAKLYVTEKSSGVTYSFDPDSKAWSGPYDLRPDGSVFSSAVGFAGDGRLILVGAFGSAENLRGVKVWEIKNDASHERKELIGEMPAAMVERMKGEGGVVASIGMSCGGDMVCLHNPGEPGEVIMCELGKRGCRWGSVRNAEANDGTRLQRLVVTCSTVGMPDLQKAVKVGVLKIA